MAQFTVNSNPPRIDPYKDFRFQIKWDGRYVAGFSKVSALNLTSELAEHCKGEDHSSVRKSLGHSNYGIITLESGMTHNTDFEKWANKPFGSGLDAEVSLMSIHKDIIIEVYNEAGQLALAYNVYRCWVTEFQAIPDLDASANAVAIQSLKLDNEGWIHDYEVTEQSVPTFTEPK